MSGENVLSLEDANPSCSRMPSVYTFDNVTGWRGYRLLRPGRGMYHDVRRRLPYYLSDITDAFAYRTVASIIRMYFVKQVYNLNHQLLKIC
jgi:hypothetical protein